MQRYIGLGCFVVLTFGTTALANEDARNVLFVAVDDMRVELNCYGQTHVHSPNLDRLAARATLFERAYCQQAVCNPSRASLLTGLRPDTIHVWDLPTHFRQNVPDVITLPQIFMINGYHTQCIGKIFHNWVQDDYQGDAPSWSVPQVMHYNSHGNDHALVEGDLPPNLSSTPRTELRDVPDEAYFDGRIANLAKEALGELSLNRKPFFLAVGFWKPHAQFNAPKKYWDLYPEDSINLPENPLPPSGVPEIALHDSREIKRGFKLQPGETIDDSSVKSLRRGYYAAISYVDAQIGKVLDELERLGLRENTIVVFWSDHGYHLGEHGLWAKTSNFELDTQVPLMIAIPGQQPRRVDSIVELLDIYPTLCGLCGLSPSGDLQGQDLSKLCLGEQQPLKNYAISQHTRPAYPSAATPLTAIGYSLRTNRFRYTEWRSVPSGEILACELYDHQLDSRETMNLANEPDDATTQQIDELKSQLQQCLTASSD
ncbi:MAG: sulfatase [Planctomycetales bacterium]|nr:sulfatase [Planctomycetales bacterium]